MKKILCLSLLGFSLFASSNVTFNPNKIEAKVIKKEQPSTYAINFNGTYEVPLKLNMKMGQDAFSKTGLVEKIDENYYFTFTQLDSGSLAEMKLLSEGKVGTMIKEKNGAKLFTYTVSEEDLSKEFKFSAVVTAMDKLVNFGVELQLDDLSYLGDQVEDRGERPARFIPEIETNATDVEVEKDTLFILPEASAKLKNEEIPLKKQVFYRNNGKYEEIEVKDNKFRTSKLGTYKVKYTAESDLYKTSLGNNTKEEFSFKVTSKVGATAIGKFEDINNVLPKNAQLQTTILTKGETFEKVQNLMLKIADNFQVFELQILDENGTSIDINGDIKFSLRVDDYFNRNEVKIAKLDEEKLVNFDIENYGRYIKFNSNSDGIYIAYVEGVEFHMPMWGYILIGASVLTVAIAITVTSIVLVKKKKKREESKN